MANSTNLQLLVREALDTELLKQLCQIKNLSASEARPLRRRVCAKLGTAIEKGAPDSPMSWVHKSTLFGNGDRQLKRPSTWARLVEVLPELTQLNLIGTAVGVADGVLEDSYMADTAFQFYEALINPINWGTPDNSKTGYTIGMHKNWNAERQHLLGAIANLATDICAKRNEGEGEPTPTPQEPQPFRIKSTMREALDKVLRTMTDDQLDCATLEGCINEGSAAKAELEILKKSNGKWSAKIKEFESRVKSLEAELKAAPTHASIPAVKLGSQEIPEGKQTVIMAKKAFGLESPSLDFPVPCFEWEGEHPHVPAIDSHYKFNPVELASALIGLKQNRPTWMWGHSGSGKSSLIEQIAARLGWPCRTLNFDGELTRLDVVGREVLQNDNGTTISKFIEGILPAAMQGPCILLADELDFVLEDVAYVFQTVLANKTLTLTEDGGRVIHADPFFRFIATANTNGQGDLTGLYRGARVQSAALLNRFTNWVKKDYFEGNTEAAIVAERVPLDQPFVERLASYINEHRTAFTTSKIMQPLSQRDLVGFAESYRHYCEVGERTEVATNKALDDTILSRATPNDYTILNGIAQRVFG